MELERREFWATHYYLLLAEEEHDSEELVEPIFGVSSEAVETYYLKELVRPAAKGSPHWLDLLAGARVGVEYAGDGDGGTEVRFLVNRDSWEGSELLGYDSGHFALPAFRWPELEAIHRAVAVSDPAKAAAAALLLFPATYVTNDEDSGRIQEHLVSWWRTLGFARPEFVERLACNTAAYRSVPEVRWHLDATLGWINDSVYSLRNPQTRMCAFEERRFLRVKEFMTEVDRAA
jgi:hypothetical protein